jgi:DNA-binding response OmpR family regulator
MSQRVVLIGPLTPSTAGVEASLKNRGDSVVVADDVRHALLLVRAFAPDVLVAAAALSAEALALLMSSWSRPLVVLADLGVDAAMALLRQGVSRVVPPRLGPAALAAVLDAPLRFERPVARALAQLGLLKCTGALVIGDPVEGEVVVDNGRIHSASAGKLTAVEAVKLLAVKPAPLPLRFVASDELLADLDVDIDIDIAVKSTSGDIVLDDIDIEAAASTGHVVQVAPRTVDEVATLLPPTVLVVEDDPDLARLYALLLKSRGCVTHIAFDGADGYAAVCAAPPDLVLTDIMMPRQTGWDLLSLIRNNARLRELRVVLLSHHGEMVTRLKSANSGADGYLQKSMRPEAVVNAVIELLQPRRDLALLLAADAPRVEGDMMGIGPQTLLRLLARNSATGRLQVRAGDTHYAVGFHGGDVVDARCTMGQASLQHRDALRALILADDGSYTFIRGPQAAAFSPLALVPLLDELCVEIEQLLENLRTDVLSTGAPLRVRIELLAVYRANMPDAAKLVIDRIAAGATPRDIIVSGSADPVLVDSVVRDLFRKGVVTP